MRFKEFTESWESYKVSELLNTIPTNSLSWDQLTYNQESSIKNLHYGLIHNGLETTCITGRNPLFPYINHSFIPTKYTLIQNGDLILADASEDRKDVGKPVEMLDVDKQNIISGLHTIHARNKTNLIENGFKGYYFKSNAMKQQIFKIANGSKIYGISSSAFNELKMFIPEKQEQKKIVDLMIIIEERIQTQIKIIEDLVLQKKLITANIFTSMESLVWNKLSSLEKDEIITLKRGNIIPKHIYDTEYCYPVYSSSIHNNGLMGYSNSFMFNKELVTWSIDGGGNFFYRNKHKFNVTNVSGILELNQNLYDYYFVAEILEYQHSKFIFDYQTKAHPSVIGKMYSLPEVSLDEQKRIVNILKKFNRKLQTERDLLTYYKKQKAYLLKNMFI